MGILVLAHAEQSLDEVALKLAASASVRLAPAALPGRVRVRGQIIDGEMTVAAAGLTALDRFDVLPREAP